VAMTKADNRAAAKAYQQERMQKHRDEACALAVAADVEELRRLRNYLIFKAKVRIPYGDLTKAIDDYVEKLTGDRTTLHAPRHGIGYPRVSRYTGRTAPKVKPHKKPTSAKTTPPRGNSAGPRC
jgi:hypothetical protein